MDGDSISLQALGWMDDAAGQEFVELLLDRDLSQWGEPPLWQRENLTAGNIRLSGSAEQAEANIIHRHDRLDTAAAGPYNSVESWYFPPPGQLIAKLLYSCTTIAGVGAGDANWDNVVFLTGPAQDVIDHNGNSVAGQALVATGPRAAATVRLLYKGTHTGDGDWQVRWHDLAAVGTHGIALHPRLDSPDGIYVSDAIKYLWQKYYPQVDVSGVEQTTYPVPHAVWRDPVKLPDATADLNKYHAWKFGVWEGKKLEFAPHDFTVVDWQVRAGEAGVEVQAAGDSSEAVFNGATVSWTDFGGQTHFLSARDTADLRDDSPWIPANQWGKERYLPVNISWQCEQAGAIAIAQVILAGANRAKRPSVITVPYYIRNGAGDWRPVGEVRSGQTIAVTNLVGDEPRLITATDVQDHRLVVSTDDAIADLETYLYRLDSQAQIGAPR